MTDPIRINPSSDGQLTGGLPASPGKVSGPSFADMLNTSQVKFSNHAQKRLETRSIELDSDHISRLSTAMDKANAHGARESLILMDDLAFIVNVQQRMVVTTVDVNQRSEGVFTQIDSVVLADIETKNNGH